MSVKIIVPATSANIGPGFDSLGLAVTSYLTVTVVEENVDTWYVDHNLGEKIIDVPNRSQSRLARAPQCFYLRDILEAHEKARKSGKHDFIDSCSMMQYYGYDMYLVDGPQENIKVTTPDDFYTMRALLDAKEDAQIYGLDE